MILSAPLCFLVAAAMPMLSPHQELGKAIFFDANLSTPPGVSCATCHDPAVAFADPRPGAGTSQGSVPTRFGFRNSPTVAYARFSPELHFIEGMGPDGMGVWAGGQNWDGSTSNLAEQAKRPFLSRLEMNNPNEWTVVVKVLLGPYAEQFKALCGTGTGVDAAYACIADALAAYESSREVNRFSSRYDRHLAGEATLSEQELRGLALYEGKAACSRCHPNRPGAMGTGGMGGGMGPGPGMGGGGMPPMFTTRHHANVGVPRNPENPYYAMPRGFNPDGFDFLDPGTGAVVGEDAHRGRFKIPTLRNVAVTAPYMHNGVIPDLATVVHFYNTRDEPDGGWAPPEWDLPSVVRLFNLGRLGLTEAEEADVVAFLHALTDE